jgi:hypothetical protein
VESEDHTQDGGDGDGETDELKLDAAGVAAARYERGLPACVAGKTGRAQDAAFARGGPRNPRL